MSFDNVTKHIRSIESVGHGPPENSEKNFGPPQPKNRNRAFDTRKDYHHPRGDYTSRGKVGGEAKTYLCIACIMRGIQTIRQGIVQFSWNRRKR
jgi:hypothetical protein